MKLETIKPLTKKSKHKYCIYSRGGLGDAIRKYFDTGDGWEYLSDLKQKHPDAIVKYIALNANQQTANFFKLHPHLDCVMRGKWSHPHIPCKIINELKGDGYKLLHNSKEFKVRKQVKIYLNDDDKALVTMIKSRGPYIVLHPFAGEDNRRMMPIKEYFPLVDQIAKLDINVVVIGANWQRGPTNISTHKITESFPYEHSRLINLIDKANPRAVAGLVFNSRCLLSVRSFCFAMTKSGKIKSIVLVSSPKTKNPKYLTVNQSLENMLAWGWSRKNLDENIVVIGADHDFKDARKHILESVKAFVQRF